MRAVPLTALRGGINRLRVKGGARADSLYDLVNAYVTQAGAILPREGTIRAATLTSGSVGLVAYNGIFNVFSNSLISVPSGYQSNVLVHPTNASLAVTKIWFAQPFMGFLYVVAQFSNGDIFHYWLQSGGSWAASTVYDTGAIVTPDTPNGFGYQAVRDTPVNPTWSSETVVAAGNMIEPTAYTGYAYRAIAVAGGTPHTGATEPVWPTTIGGTVQEFGDFDLNTNDLGTTTGSTTVAVPLGSTITNRYGDSNTIAGNVGTTSTQATTVAASTTVSTWTPGTSYSPGAVVKPSTNQGAFVNAIPNGDFEAGDDGNWVLTSHVSIEGTLPYQGSKDCKFGGPTTGPVNLTATMNNYGVVTPGQSVTATAYVDPNCNAADASFVLYLRWYDNTDTFISSSASATVGGVGYRQLSVTGLAPANAAHVRVQIQYNIFVGQTQVGFADLVTWNLTTAAAVSNFLYEAVQAAAGSSGSTEPTWPTIAGNTVTDGTVTWKAIGTSIITWQAIPIMRSGTSQPTFPTTVGLTVNDPSTYTSTDGNVNNTSMSWICVNRQITDTNDPNTKAVALAASHVFAGSNDITAYSAAVDPTDWSSANNAGYLPTGLNNYGGNPVTVLALYRSNLVVFNAGGYQMWQVDPDPQNMALLDAQPVGSIYPRAAQSVSNDLIFLTEVGVRNLGTVGATANMQIGGTGQPVDVLIKEQLQAGTYDPLALYYPGRGQYWIIFGPQAFVLTINGPNQKSWSRFVFPDTITDWTLSAGILYLRTAGDLVWQFDANTLVDDYGGANVLFSGVIQWPYLDLGQLGVNKMLVGVDLVGDGDVSIQVAFDQADKTSFNDNAGFATSTSVTAPYDVAVSDTVPGEPLPIPINAPSYSLILTFSGNQAWSWEAANLYLADQGGGGATG